MWVEYHRLYEYAYTSIGVYDDGDVSVAHMTCSVAYGARDVIVQMDCGLCEYMDLDMCNLANREKRFMPKCGTMAMYVSERGTNHRR